jgi:hypothetical protein
MEYLLLGGVSSVGREHPAVMTDLDRLSAGEEWTARGVDDQT